MDILEDVSSGLNPWSEDEGSLDASQDKDHDKGKISLTSATGHRRRIYKEFAPLPA